MLPACYWGFGHLVTLLLMNLFINVWFTTRFCLFLLRFHFWPVVLLPAPKWPDSVNAVISAFIPKLYYSILICQSQQGDDWNRHFEATQPLPAQHSKKLLGSDAHWAIDQSSHSVSVLQHSQHIRSLITEAQKKECGAGMGARGQLMVPLRPTSPWSVLLFSHGCKGKSFWLW